MAVDSFTVEAWTYLAIDLVVVATRAIARWRQMGLRDMAPDDFLMIIAALLYTAETATAHYVGAYWHGLANSGMTDAERAALDPNGLEYHLRVKGSQTQLFGWLVYTVLLWVLKTCWLFFFKRLGDGVGHMALKINIGFVFIGTTFLATFFTILFGCYPVEKHWQIYPDPGNFCYPAVSRLQALVLICTNLTTDFYIMSIPLPMVWSARIAFPKKMGLCVMFCGGLITAVFGALRCAYVLANTPDGPQQAGEWSCRESFVAVFVTNFPILFPIVHRAFRTANHKFSSYSGGYGGAGSSSRDKNLGAANNNNTKTSSSKFKLSTISNKKDHHKKNKFQHPLSLPAETFYERFGSEEDIIVPTPIPEDTASDSQSYPNPNQNQQTQTQQGSISVSASASASASASTSAPENKSAVADEDIRVTTEWRVQSHHADADAVARQRRDMEMGFAHPR